MNRNMYKWARDLCDLPEKKALPVLSFPGLQLTNVSLLDGIHNSTYQAECMKAVSDRCNMAAAVSLMDLSVEAEAFGSTLHFCPDIVPNIVGSIVKTKEDADKLRVPKVGELRTQTFLDGIEKATKMIEDRPTFCGILAPFSLAGRIIDVTDLLRACRNNKPMAHEVLEKITQFQINFINAYKQIGADGVLLAEPQAGLLGPAQDMEFSVSYCKRIVEAVQEEHFVCVYHNCGPNTPVQKEIYDIGCVGYHFGNCINMLDVLKSCPSDVCCMGNIDPVSQFVMGNPAGIYNATMDLMKECCPKYTNFVISSGCDIPEQAKWENIDAFFKAVDVYYGRATLTKEDKEKMGLK